jgi:hypothetical protein
MLGDGIAGSGDGEAGGESFFVALLAGYRLSLEMLNCCWLMLRKKLTVG